MMAQNPNDLDTKEELIAYTTKLGLDFLKKHYWKLILIIISIGLALIPFIWIDGGLAGVFK
jgi:hypothetical protein